MFCFLFFLQTVDTKKGSLFVSLQCKEGGFPHDLWLSVSAENVSVYKRGEPKPLETFPYEHIIFFGAPQPCTYKITVDEREMFFDTPQVPHQNFTWSMLPKRTR